MILSEFYNVQYKHTTHLGFVKKRIASIAYSRQKKIRDFAAQAVFLRPNKRNRRRKGVGTICYAPLVMGECGCKGYQRVNTICHQMVTWTLSESYCMREVGGGLDHGRRSQELSDKYYNDTCEKPVFVKRTTQSKLV
jgi:hypothetical protein